MSLHSCSENSALFKCTAFRISLTVLRTAIFLSLFSFMCEMIRVFVLRNCPNIKLLCADNNFFFSYKDQRDSWGCDTLASFSCTCHSISCSSCVDTLNTPFLRLCILSNDKRNNWFCVMLTLCLAKVQLAC